MNHQKGKKFPEDFFSKSNHDEPKYRNIKLSPINTKNNKKNLIANSIEDSTPYFKPLGKYSSCANIILQAESPVLQYKKRLYPFTQAKKQVLPSLKPQIHLMKNHKNLRTTIAFEVLNKKLFNRNQIADPGMTFSRNSACNSNESAVSNIFTGK